MSQGADIAFPHLGITIGHLPKGITIGGFTIAFYGIIIACGMLDRKSTRLNSSHSH